MIAIGIGCRRGCGAAEIVELVQRGWRLAGTGARTFGFASQALEIAISGDGFGTGEPEGSRSGVRLCSVVEKQTEAGLLQAAATLGLPLVFFPAAILAKQQPHLTTRSDRVTALFGTPSVAEAAALAGAGAGAQLLVPRLASAGATCAIAIGGEAA